MVQAVLFVGVSVLTLIDPFPAPAPLIKLRGLCPPED